MNSNNHIEFDSQTEEQKEGGIKKLKSFCNLTLSVSSVFAVIQSLSNFEASHLAISGFFIGLVVSASLLKSYLECYTPFSKKVKWFFTVYLFLAPLFTLVTINSPVQKIMEVPVNGFGIGAINSALKYFSLDKGNALLLILGSFILATFFFGISATLIYTTKYFFSYFFIISIILIQFVASYSPVSFIIVIVSCLLFFFSLFCMYSSKLKSNK